MKLHIHIRCSAHLINELQQMNRFYYFMNCQREGTDSRRGAEEFWVGKSFAYLWQLYFRQKCLNNSTMAEMCTLGWVWKSVCLCVPVFESVLCFLRVFLTECKVPDFFFFPEFYSTAVCEHSQGNCFDIVLFIVQF